MSVARGGPGSAGLHAAERVERSLEAAENSRAGYLGSLLRKAELKCLLVILVCMSNCLIDDKKS